MNERDAYYKKWGLPKPTKTVDQLKPGHARPVAIFAMLTPDQIAWIIERNRENLDKTDPIGVEIFTALYKRFVSSQNIEEMETIGVKSDIVGE